MKKINKKEDDEVKKRKIILLFVIGLFIIIFVNLVNADTLYWVGTSGGNWSDSSNWASSSGGAGGGM